MFFNEGIQILYRSHDATSPLRVRTHLAQTLKVGLWLYGNSLSLFGVLCNWPKKLAFGGRAKQK
jgi:hypothetical protein